MSPLRTGFMRFGVSNPFVRMCAIRKLSRDWRLERGQSAISASGHLLGSSLSGTCADIYVRKWTFLQRSKCQTLPRIGLATFCIWDGYFPLALLEGSYLGLHFFSPDCHSNFGNWPHMLVSCRQQSHLPPIHRDFPFLPVPEYRFSLCFLGVLLLIGLLVLNFGSSDSSLDYPSASFHTTVIELDWTLTLFLASSLDLLPIFVYYLALDFAKASPLALCLWPLAPSL